MKRFLKKILRKLVGSVHHADKTTQTAINCKWGPLCEFRVATEPESSMTDAKWLLCTECGQSVRRIDSESADIWEVLHSQSPFFLDTAVYQEQVDVEERGAWPFDQDETDDAISDPLTQSDPGLLEIERLRILHHQGSRGYGYLRKAAELAVAMYGTAWLHEPTPGSEDSANWNKLRRMVLRTAPKTHTNTSVVWRRFQDYALEAEVKK